MMLLALPQPGPRLASRAPGRHGLQLEHRAQAQTQQARAADPQDVAPRDPQLRIAQIFPSLSGYDDHRVAPWCRTRSVASRPRLAARMSNKYCIVSKRICPAENALNFVNRFYLNRSERRRQGTGISEEAPRSE